MKQGITVKTILIQDQNDFKDCQNIKNTQNLHLNIKCYTHEIRVNYNLLHHNLLQFNLVKKTHSGCNLISYRQKHKNKKYKDK